MKIHAGYDITYECPGPTPMILMLSVHPSRMPDVIGPHRITVSGGPGGNGMGGNGMGGSDVGATEYRDGFGNICHRILAPAGRTTISTRFDVLDPGVPDVYAPEARQLPVEELPDEALVFLLPSRYCETDRMSDLAWSLFGHTQPGWSRVQAIVDYAHNRLTFGYEHANVFRSAHTGHSDRVGVCRDFAHLAVTLCRCMNIPARYCTGYLGDIGVPPVDAAMDFSAWFEVYLGGHWYTFDARHNTPRIGRILMARGRDAADVAITTTFGPNRLAGFHVVTDEVKPDLWA